MGTEFWQNDINFWLQKLNSTPDGLSQAEARQRLSKRKKLPHANTPFRQDLKLFIRQYQSPLMLLLLVAVLLSAFLGDTSDVLIILFILLSTGSLSFWQERNAGRVVEKLKSLLEIKVTVVRDGITVEVESNQLTPGDVLLFKAGQRIPADCLLIEANLLQVNESSLTGESFPVTKEPGVMPAKTSLANRSNCLWQGSSVVSGSGKALVIATDEDTVFSSIAQSASLTVETGFEKGIRNFGLLLMRVTLVLSLFILVVNLLNRNSLMESALFALALAVGMAPELLPAINTIAMSAGAKRMLAQKVVVKKLASIQNLGEIDLLCTDKTGTLTEGAIEVADIVNGMGVSDNYVRELAYWNAFFESGYTNPIDEALKNMMLQPTLQPQKEGEIPYDFNRKRLSIVVSTPEERILITKGSFTETLSICTQLRTEHGELVPIANFHDALVNRYEQFGVDGYRCIAICYKVITDITIDKSVESDMIFAGFIVMHDPVKNGVLKAIERLHKLQINLKIITGDNRHVAAALAKKIGMTNTQVLTGEDINKLSHDDLAQRVKTVNLFAEVAPQQKEQLIRALRQTYTVAYMGDGINDVGALVAADVGLSVDNAVDVARDAADFVLLERSLSVIADGVVEGRKTFANTLKYIYINTGATFGNMFSVAAASLLLPFLPMLPKQILMTNFITDLPYLSVSSDNVDTEQLKKPGKWNMKLIRNYMFVFGFHSTLFDLITFLTLFYGFKVSESAFQTGWFTESILTELFILFIIRTYKSFFKSRPGRMLFILSLLGLGLTLALPYTPIANTLGLVPLQPEVALSLFGIVLLYVLTADALKIVFFRYHLKKKTTSN